MNLMRESDNPTGSMGDRRFAMEGTGKWAVRKYKDSRAHIWMEDISDTMCRMRAAGGMPLRDKYEIVSQRGGHKICTMCLNNFLTILRAQANLIKHPRDTLDEGSAAAASAAQQRGRSQQQHCAERNRALMITLLAKS
jgi:hypothetical protein